MNVDQKVTDRLAELIALGERVLTTAYRPSPSPNAFSHRDATVNSQLSHQWGASSLGILRRVFGEGSDYYIQFEKRSKEFGEQTPVSDALGILRAAKDDYEHGYLFNVRSLVQAEVFDDFLEQAEHLLDVGYFQPAAVIAGAVLEDALRRLCDQNGIALPSKPKLDAMNAELTKMRIYNGLVQKQITTLADLRNKAAHGQWDQFTKDDVARMVPEIRTLLRDRLA